MILFTLFTGRYQFGLKWCCTLAGCDRHSDKKPWTKNWALAFARYFPRGACWNRLCISTEGWRLAGLRGVAEAAMSGGEGMPDAKHRGESHLPHLSALKSTPGRRGSLKFHRAGGSHADNPGDGVFLLQPESHGAFPARTQILTLTLQVLGSWGLIWAITPPPPVPVSPCKLPFHVAVAGLEEVCFERQVANGRQDRHSPPITASLIRSWNMSTRLQTDKHSSKIGWLTDTGLSKARAREQVDK